MRRVPDDTTTTWPDDKPAWNVTVAWAIVDGRAQPVGLSVLPIDERRPEVLTSRKLRDLRLHSITEPSRQARLQELEQRSEQLKSARTVRQDEQELLEAHRQGVERERDLLRTKPSRGGHPVERDDAFYEEVAKVYRDYIQTGGTAPRAYIARRYGFSESAASKWIARARRDGKLGPYEGPSGGGQQ
jgi:hypothetical protein